ncbi:Kinesin-like protein kif21b [Paramecium bursaria]
MECLQTLLHDHQEKLPKSHLKNRVGLKQFLEQEIQETKAIYIQQMQIVDFCLENFQKLFLQIQNATKELELILKEQVNYQQNIIQLENILSNLLTISDFHQLNYEKFVSVFEKDQIKLQVLDHQQLLSIAKQIHDQSKTLLNCDSFTTSQQGEFPLYFGDQRNNFIIDKKQLANQIYQLSNITKVLDNYNFEKQSQELDDKQKLQTQQKQIYEAEYQGLIQQKSEQFREMEIYKSELSIYTSTISPNEQFLAFGGQDEYLQIHNLKNLGKILKIKIDLEPTSSTFTINSQKLVLGGFEGEMICFDANDNFSQVFYSQVHKDRINAMICINDFEILSGSNTNLIIVTNLESGEQIFQIAQDFILIYGLSYDFYLNAIFTGSQDHCIRVFNKDTRNLTLQRNEAHFGCILQLQVIQQKNKLLSLCENGLLKVWLVDYNRKFLMEIQSIKEKNLIENFRSISNDAVLILISDNQISISWRKQHQNLVLQHQVKDQENVFTILNQIKLIFQSNKNKECKVEKIYEGIINYCIYLKLYNEIRNPKYLQDQGSLDNLRFKNMENTIITTQSLLKIFFDQDFQHFQHFQHFHKNEVQIYSRANDEYNQMEYIKQIIYQAFPWIQN